MPQLVLALFLPLAVIFYLLRGLTRWWKWVQIGIQAVIVLKWLSPKKPSKSPKANKNARGKESLGFLAFDLLGLPLTTVTYALGATFLQRKLLSLYYAWVIRPAGRFLLTPPLAAKGFLRGFFGPPKHRTNQRPA